MYPKETKELARSSLLIATYIVITLVLQSVSFGFIQVRLANTLYGLCFLFPYLVVPMGIASGLSNLLLGGLGLVDVILGGLSTGIICYIISKLKNPLWIIPTITVGISLLISSYLHVLLNVPFELLVPNLLLGQLIPAVLSYVLVKRLL
jgi:uncharacterized membrane protein